MDAPQVLIAVVLIILVVVLAVLCAALASNSPGASRVVGGTARPWWEDDVPPGVQKAVRTYAQRAIVPKLRRGDRAPFNKVLRDALRGGPTREDLAALQKFLRRSKLSGYGAGRGEAGRASHRAQEIIDLVPPGASGPYLDLGCGDGTITSAVSKALGVRATCIEVGPRPRNFPRNVKRVDAGKLSRLGAATFGVATALMSLHHLEDPDTILAELARVVRAGGILVIREHDLKECPHEITSPEGARQYLDWIHILYDLAEGLEPEAFGRSRYHTPEEWAAMLARAGFVPVGSAQFRGDRVCSYYAAYSRE